MVIDEYFQKKISKKLKKIKEIGKALLARAFQPIRV